MEVLSKHALLRKVLIAATIFTVVWTLGYLIGRLVLQQTNLSFRGWVILSGEGTLLAGWPLLAVVWFLVWLAGQIKKSALTAVSAVLSIGYLIWVFLVVLILAFSLDSETSISSRLIVKIHTNFLDPNEYSYYRPVGLFFKEPGKPDTQDALDYLTETYERSFFIEDGRIYDKEFSKYAVTAGLHDTEYTDNLADCILAECAETCFTALGQTWEYHLDGDNRLCLVPDDISDLSALAEVLYPLINAIRTQTDFFDQHQGWFDLEYLLSGKSVTISVPVGYESIYSKQFVSADSLTNYLEEEYTYNENLYSTISRTEAEEGSAHTSESNTESTTEASEGESPLSGNADPDTSVAKTNALIIYDEVLAAEGYTCEVCYNAKGNLYLDLGSRDAGEEGDAYDTGTYRFTLVYDRTSANGNCELYVLYKEHYTENADGSSTNDTTAILDMYAVETATGKVVASGRQAWNDVGSAEYREITGE